jgi:hypothetical protein
MYIYKETYLRKKQLQKIVNRYSQGQTQTVEKIQACLFVVVRGPLTSV